jgi:hypothetical protein
VSYVSETKLRRENRGALGIISSGCSKLAVTCRKDARMEVSYTYTVHTGIWCDLHVWNSHLFPFCVGWQGSFLGSCGSTIGITLALALWPHSAGRRLTAACTATMTRLHVLLDLPHSALGGRPIFIFPRSAAKIKKAGVKYCGPSGPKRRIFYFFSCPKPYFLTLPSHLRTHFQRSAAMIARTKWSR